MTSQFAAVVARLVDTEVLEPKSIAMITSTCRGAERIVRERRLTVVRHVDRITWTSPFGSLASIRRRLRQCAERALTVSGAGCEELHLLTMIRPDGIKFLDEQARLEAVSANVAVPAVVDDAADAYHFVLDVILRSGEHFHRVLAPDAVRLEQPHDEFDPTTIIINERHIPPRFVTQIPEGWDPDFQESFQRSTDSIGFAVVRGRDSKVCTLFRGRGSAEHMEWDRWDDWDDPEFRCELPNARRLLDMTFPAWSLSLETGATLLCRTADDTDDGADGLDILMHRLKVDMYYRISDRFSAQRDPPRPSATFPRSSGSSTSRRGGSRWDASRRSNTVVLS